MFDIKWVKKLIRKTKVNMFKSLKNIYLTKTKLILSQYKITHIFCSIDYFCNDFVLSEENQLISNGKKRIKKSNLSLSEIITLQVLFLFLVTKDFAHYLSVRFIDSTPLRIYKSRRIYQFKTFIEIVQRGLCFLGLFFVFNLDLNNDCSRIINFMHTLANIQDTNPL